tara:strand:+ start:153 stop:353 length:201 start_codon:yes stop_codon:yes gene_type:complete
MELGEFPLNQQDKPYIQILDLTHGLLHQQQHQYVLFVLVAVVVLIEPQQDLVEVEVVDWDGKMIYL